jgi:thymidylate synthase ThyX
LKQRFPKTSNESQNVYDKAIKARAFDIARGFLPAGSGTNVSWHTNIRQAHDHLKNLRHHPLSEVRILADEILQSLQQKYTSSFLHKRYDSEEKYLAQSASAFAYYHKDSPLWQRQEAVKTWKREKDLSLTEIGDFSWENRLDIDGLSQFKDLLQSRPRKSELHHRFRQFGDMLFTFPLDYGSFRDLQRHRSSVQNMPLLTHDLGFDPWYFEQMPQGLQHKAEDMLGKQKRKFDKLSGFIDPVELQYFIPMGYRVKIHMSCSLPSAVYIAELRSSDTVHPTLRKMAQKMGNAIKEAIPYIAMHHDLSDGTVWNTKRGNQDITEKQ